MRVEIDKEAKIANIRARFAMEEALHAWKDRWILCWDGESPKDSGFDCACCISWYDINTCECICHGRIRELDSLISGILNGIEREKKCWWNTQ